MRTLQIKYEQNVNKKNKGFHLAGLWYNKRKYHV